MTDTPREVEARFRRMILARSPAERLAMACRMFGTAKALVRAGILQTASGDPGPKELRERMFLRLYGRDFDASQRQKVHDHLRTVQ